MEVKVHFCSSNLPFALLIKLFTFSKWNHVAIEVGGIVYEARAWYGVTKTTFEELSSRQNKIYTKEVHGLDGQAVRNFCEDQVGKKYDYRAIVALPFKRDWGREFEWFCSELGTKALISGGRLFKKFPAYRVTPERLLQMLGGQSGK